MRLLTLISCFIITTSTLNASLYCPPNKVVECDEDLNNPNVTGMATTYGSHAYYVASYILIEPDNNCGVGINIKRWYVDENYDGQLNPGEHFCDQEILVEYHPYPITFNIPPDVTVSCLDDVPEPSYSWSGGSPCDVIGYNVEDKDFTVEDGDCYKVRRKYTFLNWCTYMPNDPNWNGEGKWEFYQTIKVIDDEKPELESCAMEEFGVGVDCITEVTLTNSAKDIGACPGNKMEWKIELDLWADGSTDYVFGYTETGIFNTPSTQNDEEISITIPELLGPGNHKVKWNVRDACGNWTSCLTTFRTIDNKPPTPYCHSVIFASFDGSNDMKVEVDANLFDVGSFDFCYPDYIKMSFSEDPEDDTLVIDCVNAGFQFLNVYAHDKAGNSDFCETFLLIFDNGTCNSRISAAGLVVDTEGQPLNNVSFKVERPNELIMTDYTNLEGELMLEDLPMYNDITFPPTLSGLDRDKIDILDLIIMQDHLLGKGSIEGPALLAMDLNDDNRITPVDFKEMTDYLLNRTESFSGNDWKFIQTDNIDNFNLRNYSESIAFLDYQGNLDCTGIMSGDISSLENRTELNIELIAGETNSLGYTPYYSSENFETKGLHLKFFTSIDVEISKGQFEVREDNFEQNNDWANWIIHEGSYTSTTPLFYIKDENVKAFQGFGYSVDYDKQSITLRNSNTKGELNLYPNPVSNELFVDYSKEIKEIRIIDLFGNEVYKSNNSLNAIDVSFLNSGSYILEVLNGQESINKVFVKI